MPEHAEDKNRPQDSYTYSTAQPVPPTFTLQCGYDVIATLPPKDGTLQ